MKDLLRIKFELLVTPLFITLLVMSIKYVGFMTIRDIIFNVVLIISIPLVYISIRKSRKLIYYVWYGERI
jgi:hypothetical protein